MLKAFDGNVRMTLCGQCMPAWWLYEPLHLLPAMVTVGGYRCGTRVDLMPCASSLLGYRLVEPCLFNEGFMDLAFECAEASLHCVRRGRVQCEPFGHHYELAGLIAKGAFDDLVPQDASHQRAVLLRIFDRLKEPLLFNANVAGLPA